MPFRRSACRVLDPVVDFLRIGAVGGAVLLAATIAALLLANSPLAHGYQRLWQHELTVGGVRWELRHWVNDALMTIFFLVIGLEVKREFTIGRLRDPGRATLRSWPPWPERPSPPWPSPPSTLTARRPGAGDSHGHRPGFCVGGPGPARFLGAGRGQGLPAGLGRTRRRRTATLW